MNIDLTGKNAIVTGGARGIGFSLVKGLESAGAKVLVLDKFVLDKNMESIPRLSPNTEIFQIDLADENEYGRLYSYVCENYSSIDILINNAGITIPDDPSTYPISSWKKTLDINVTAPFLLTKTLIEHLISSNKASVINITSLNSDLGFPNNPSYVASKSALAGLTRSMAVDFGSKGIRVNSLAPGYIKTDMTGESWNNIEKRKARQNRTCLGRWGTPDDLIGPMLFLASDMSKYVTGQTLFVDGGWTIKGL